MVPTESTDAALQTLEAVQDRVLWVSIMTALWFEHLRAPDRVSVKPHASPVLHAIELHDQINVGFAVASEDALVVPTVMEADAKSLGQIAADTRRLAARVRAVRCHPPS